jgi:hypothetical protein
VIRTAFFRSSATPAVLSLLPITTITRHITVMPEAGIMADTAAALMEAVISEAGIIERGIVIVLLSLLPSHVSPAFTLQSSYPRAT